MKQIFTPAIAFLNRLKYPQKFALISLLLIVPLAVVMTLLVVEIDNRIEFTQKELDGTAYLRPLRTLLELVPEANLAAGTRSGADVLQHAEVQQIHAQIDQALAELAEVDRQYGAQFGSSDAAANLGVAWSDLKRDLKLLQPAARTLWYNRIVEHSRALLAHVGDRSNLILDPDLNSYYLMDAVLLKLPEEQMLLGQTLWFGVQLPVDYIVTTEERVQMTVYRGRLESHAQAQHNSLEVAFRNDSSGRLVGALREPLTAKTAATAAFNAEIDRHIFRAQNGYPDQFVPLGAAALESSFQLWDLTVVELDALLRARIAGVSQQKLMVQLLAGSMLLLVGYLLIAFYLSVMRTVSRLELTAERLVLGNTAELVDLNTRDELGQVARSFNQIATALLTASAHRQAIFTHAVDGIITLDEQGAVVSCNPAAEHLFGYSSAEIVGRPVTLLMPGYCASHSEGVASRREEYGRRQDGAQFPLDLALSEMSVGRERLTMVIARDITERKQIEESRVQLQQTIIQAQAATLEALATPLIPVTDHVVVMPLIGALDQRRVQQVITALLHGVEEHAARVAILDITGVPTIDTAVAQGVLDAALAVRLLGASIVLTGIRPEVAQALASLGLNLGTVVTRSTLQDGIAYALAQDSRADIRRALIPQR